jgi:tetratricopeptide (TPR) repeat protein
MSVCLITIATLLCGGARGDDLAAFLVPPAEAALRQRQLGLAVPLWRGVVAIRGEGDDAAVKLADAWALAGEYDEAAEQLTRYAQTTSDERKGSEARERAVELGERPRGFAAEPLRLMAATRQAREAMARGERLRRGGRVEDAVKLFRAAIELAPDDVAAYRALAGAYAALGREQEARDLLVRYLRLRPFGKQADATRKQLGGSGVLGKLAVKSSFPCDEVWVNRQKLPPRTRGDLVVAPGKYRLLCYSGRYHFARYLDLEVPAAGRVVAEFRWALLLNRLDPWGRIVIENPDRENQMYDVGLWDEVGVPVPEDGRVLKVTLRAGDDSRSKETELRLEPGKRYSLAW